MANVDVMYVSEHDKMLALRILKKHHPDLHTSIFSEVSKRHSKEKIERMIEVSEIFEAQNTKDVKLFIAVIIKIFHPELYAKDNKEIPLQRGLNKSISEQLNLKESNTTVLIQQVRTWIKYNIDDLRSKADVFYEQNFKDGQIKEDN